jgi:hypothetical protein
LRLPDWLDELRREEITQRVKGDPRTSGDLLLGVHRDRIFCAVIEGGQADFDTPWETLSGADKVLLYAFFNQKGHLEELLAGFSLLLGNATLEDLVVLDLGCGPFTGGLALAAVVGAQCPFTYVGVDSSREMRALGERFAVVASEAGKLVTTDRHWSERLALVNWQKKAGWQPVLVIASYLLASPTIDCTELVEELDVLLDKVGRGPVVLFYTNAVGDTANRHFSRFQSALEAVGFECVDSRTDSITVERAGCPTSRNLRYALFRRDRRTTLHIEDD